MGRGKGLEEMHEILSKTTFTQIPKHKTSKKEGKTTQANNTVNKLRQGKLREINKCLLTRFS